MDHRNVSWYFWATPLRVFRKSFGIGDDRKKFRRLICLEKAKINSIQARIYSYYLIILGIRDVPLNILLIAGWIMNFRRVYIRWCRKVLSLTPERRFRDSGEMLSYEDKTSYFLRNSESLLRRCQISTKIQNVPSRSSAVKPRNLQENGVNVWHSEHA